MFCVLASFIKNDYLACFSLSDNHKYIYGQDSKSNENDDSRFLHGIKFILIIVSISLHAMTCLGFLYAQPYAPVKESEFSDFLGTILNKCYIVADNMVRMLRARSAVVLTIFFPVFYRRLLCDVCLVSNSKSNAFFLFSNLIICFQA